MKHAGLHVTAVHEAGHCIAAWYCTAVGEVQKASICGRMPGENGYVSHTLDMGQRDAEWCAMVITVAGIAAEIHAFGSALSKPSEGDLIAARSAARRVSGQFPWTEPDDVSLPFDSIYVDGIRPDEARRLSFAFRMATHVIRSHEVKFYRLVSLLMANKEITEEHASQVLGARSVIRNIGRIGGRAAFLAPPPCKAPKPSWWDKTVRFLNQDVSVLWGSLTSKF